MSVEIERKFLVNGKGWKQGHYIYVRQGYLNLDKERTVRVRLAGKKAYLTIKGINTGAKRAEYEYEIPVSDAAELIKICDGSILEKNRYAVSCGGLVWEVDEFLGKNEGLIVAEVELYSEDQAFDRPGWAGQEVTTDPRYFNSNLCTHPYCKW